MGVDNVIKLVFGLIIFVYFFHTVVSSWGSFIAEFGDYIFVRLSDSAIS